MWSRDMAATSGSSNPSDGLQHHHGRLENPESGDQLPDPRIVIGDHPAIVCGTGSDINLGLGHIDAYVDRFLFHDNLQPVTGPSLRDAGFSELCIRDATTLALRRSLMTKRKSVCHTPLH